MNNLILWRQNAIKKLAEIYDKDEADSLIKILLTQKLDLAYFKILSNDYQLENEQEESLNKDLERLLNQEPVQYIVGHVEFGECNILVNENVLIPRPETEELCEIIYKLLEQEKPLQILDVCSGSGCISLFFAKRMDNSTVYGIDISEKAIDLAKQSTSRNFVTVNYKVLDALKPEIMANYFTEKFDLIISNPPYVSLSEKVEMSNNVLNFEPHLALFTEENEETIFYDAISKSAKTLLNESGILAFEINPKFADATKKIILKNGFYEANILKDYKGNERFIIALL